MVIHKLNKKNLFIFNLDFLIDRQAFLILRNLFFSEFRVSLHHLVVMTGLANQLLNFLALQINLLPQFPRPDDLLGVDLVLEFLHELVIFLDYVGELDIILGLLESDDLLLEEVELVLDVRGVLTEHLLFL